MRRLEYAFNYLVRHNSVETLVIAAAVAVGVFLVFLFFKRYVVRRISRFAKRTKTELDDAFVGVVAATHRLFLLAAAAYIGTHFLELTPRTGLVLRTGMLVLLLLQCGVWATTGVRVWLQQYLARTVAEEGARTTTLSAFRLLAGIVTWSLVLLLVLNAFHVDATALITGLGIGGIAVALAMQKVFGDLFAAFSIFIDKPFVIGDFIIVENHLGTVVRIGLKTTRLRSLSGEEIVFSNADLLSSRIHNYKRMVERRIAFAVDVEYGTAPDVVAAVPAMLRAAVEASDGTRFDRAHFKEFGASALRYEVVYYVLTPDYTAYMDIQQAINLAIYRRFTADGIAFAFPTQTVHLARDGTDDSGSAAPPASDATPVSQTKGDV